MESELSAFSMPCPAHLTTQWLHSSQHSHSLEWHTCLGDLPVQAALETDRHLGTKKHQAHSCCLSWPFATQVAPTNINFWAKTFSSCCLAMQRL